MPAKAGHPYAAAAAMAPGLADLAVTRFPLSPAMTTENGEQRHPYPALEA